VSETRVEQPLLVLSSSDVLQINFHSEQAELLEDKCDKFLSVGNKVTFTDHFPLALDCRYLRHKAKLAAFSGNTDILLEHSGS